MSAFQYYSKMSALDGSCKRKKKKKPKAIPVKISKVENDIVDNVESTANDVLNNIYKLNLQNSIETGQKLMEWLIHPITLDNFMM